MQAEKMPYLYLHLGATESQKIRDALNMATGERWYICDSDPTKPHRFGTGREPTVSKKEALKISGVKL